MIVNKRLGLIIIATVFLLTLIPAGRASVQALSAWNTPEWIPGLIDTGLNPVIFSDPTGKMHVFNSQWVGENYSILYTQWSVGVGWTEPVDIIRSPNSQARLCGAFVDNTGNVNLIFWGGIGASADIYFTHAPLGLAGKSTAWSSPKLIGRNAIELTTAAMVSDGDGNIVVVYSGSELGAGLYSVTSKNGGETWSNAYPLYLTSSDTLWPSALKLVRSSNSTVHAVWALGDETGNSRSVHYSRLESIEGDWTSPTILAEAIRYEADTPNIIEYDGSLMVIYHNGFPTTRWMIRSSDNGQTWTFPTRLFEQVGSNGAASLVIDSSNTLHMFFGNRIGEPAIHGLWHSIWMKDRWSVPEPVVSGPQIMRGANGEEGFDPSAAQAVISRGNLLMVVWGHDPMAGPIHIWYTYAILNTPELPIKLLPGLSNEPEPTATIIKPTAIPTVQLTTFPDIPLNSNGINLNQILFWGIAPAILLIFVVLIFTRNKR
jgi:hypothetical protein